MVDNYVFNQIKTQIANKSGQLRVQYLNGGYVLVDETTGQIVKNAPQWSSSVLGIPPNSTDPHISAAAIDEAKRYLSNHSMPAQMQEALAVVAGYTSAAYGISISDLFPNNRLGVELLQAYNIFKPKSSQIGIFEINQKPNWANNLTLRGSVFESLIPPIEIITKTLPLPVLNKRYEQTISTSGGRVQLTYSIDSGKLPSGLSLNNIYNSAANIVECTITGIPIELGDYDFTIAVTDVHKQTTKQSYSGTVLAKTN